MIRKYHNHKLQTNQWQREKEPHNNHRTPGRQTKQSNQVNNNRTTALVRPVLKGHTKRRPKLSFKNNYCSMQIKSIAECSPWSILQYLQASLSYHLPLRSMFCLILSARFKQVLLYTKIHVITRDFNSTIVCSNLPRHLMRCNNQLFSLFHPRPPLLRDSIPLHKGLLSYYLKQRKGQSLHRPR